MKSNNNSDNGFGFKRKVLKTDSAKKSLSKSAQNKGFVAIR